MICRKILKDCTLHQVAEHTGYHRLRDGRCRKIRFNLTRRYERCIRRLRIPGKQPRRNRMRRRKKAFTFRSTMTMRPKNLSPFFEPKNRPLKR